MPYRPSDDVIVEEQGGDAFLLHVPSARYFGLNRAGVAVWCAVRDGTDPVDQLATRHPSIGQSQLRRDVERLLGQMLDAGLIVET
jgi:hypothetical protein